MSLKSYDPKKVSAIIGSKPVTGFADGEFITVERNEDGWALMVGADGETTRARNNNRSGKVTLTLLAASASNDYLSELQAADELASAPFPFLIKDTNGSSLYTAATAWITKPAKGGFGKDNGTREWVIETDELVPFAGGVNVG